MLDAKVEDLTVPLPTEDATLKGRVFLLGGSDDVDLPGGGGRRGFTLRPGQHAACDGRYWYPVTREADTESNWYPSDFNRELFIVGVTPQDLSLRRILEVKLSFQTAILTRRGVSLAEIQRTAARTTRAQWEIVFEHGAFATEAAAAGVAFTANAGTDVITAAIDNVPNLTPVKLSTTGTLPAPLVAGTVYYTRDTSGNDRKLALTSGGAAIDITDTGSGVHTITPQIATKNLKNVSWNATPILSHTFQIGRTPISKAYGCRIKRSLVSSVDTLTSEQIIMGSSSAGGSAPASAAFALRARLRRFDTEDDVVDPVGLVVLKGLNHEVISGEESGIITLRKF